MGKASRVEARRRYEEMALIRKSQRTGIPVSKLRKPKHKSKKGN